MSEIQKHFIDKNGNAFVAIFPDQKRANAYTQPDGITEISPPPTPNHRWIKGAWALPAPQPVTIDQVRAEADRRITALVGAVTSRQKDIRISNATREAVKLLRAGEANWSAEQAARATMLEGMDAAIDAIRAKSNALEAMDPIPLDFAVDTYWP
jgi:hypothetical protein